MGQDQAQPQFRNVIERDRAREIVRLKNSMQITEKRISEVKRSTDGMVNPIKVSIVQDSSDVQICKQRIKDFQSLGVQTQINHMLRNCESQAQTLSAFSHKFNKEITWNNIWFAKFHPLNQRLIEQKRTYAIEQKKTWVQANFENVDPRFHKDWKAKMEQEGLLCDSCRHEFMKESSKVLGLSTDSDSDSDDLRSVKLSEDELL